MTKAKQAIAEAKQAVVALNKAALAEKRAPGGPEAAELAALEAVGDAPGQQITRDNLGKFVKGVSGNPKGKPKGAKSRTTLLRLAIEEMTLRETAGSMPEIVSKALEMAKEGDQAIIKLLLSDLLKAARVQDKAEDDEDKGKTTIKVTINNFTGPKGPQPAVIDGELIRE